MTVTFDFAGKHVLVTGGTSGIGHAVAGAFADAGAHVTVTGRRDDAAAYDVALDRFSYRRCHMSDASDITQLAAALRQLDVLVNNAGENLPEGRDEWDPDVFEHVVNVNLFGAFRLSTSCRQLLSGHGAIVNMASMASFFGIEVVPGYGAAKAAVVQMTKTMSVAWAKDGIRVNAVAPGLVETNMTAPMLPFEALTAPLIARTPQGRFATPADIAPAVLFLASAAAGYVTGQTLAVDGGYSVAG